MIDRLELKLPGNSAVGMEDRARSALWTCCSSQVRAHQDKLPADVLHVEAIRFQICPFVLDLLNGAYWPVAA